MIGPIASKIYAASAAGVEQVIPHQRVQPISAVESHENTSPRSLHEESVKVSISDEAQNYLALLKGDKTPVEHLPNRSPNDYGKQLKRHRNSERPLNKDEKTGAKEDSKLSTEEKEQVKELQERDREVKTHEQQHAAIGGSYVRGGPSYDYQQGPDGQRYAVGGHVDLDTSKEATPEATARKAQVIKAAATAPGEPSSADLSVAAQASAMQLEAQREISEKITEKTTKETDDKPQSDTIEPKRTDGPSEGSRTPGFSKVQKAYQNAF